MFYNTLNIYTECFLKYLKPPGGVTISQEPTKCKVEIDQKSDEQVNHYKYSWVEITSYRNLHNENKLRISLYTSELFSFHWPSLVHRWKLLFFVTLIQARPQHRYKSSVDRSDGCLDIPPVYDLNFNIEQDHPHL